jgi:D-alanyl-D-alanine carboxypeptidase
VSRGRSWLPIAALVLLPAAPASAAPARPVTARPDLHGVLAGLVRGSHRVAPGATAYVVGPHGTWSGAAGVAIAASGVRMRSGARMRLESVSKLWTATLIMQLIARHRLSLDDTVEHWLPGILPAGRRITLRELLDHTSGLVDDNDIARNPARYLARVKDPALRAELEAAARRLAADPSTVIPARLMIRFAAAEPLRSRPGTRYHYSNIGYMIASRIAERAGGQPLAEQYRQRIIEPLGLASAAYDPKPLIRGPHAHGYRVRADGSLLDTTTWVSDLDAQGGIVANAKDEARFLMALMQGRLVGPRELREMKTPFPYTDYGLGTTVEPSGCAGIAYGHNGAGAAFTTSVFVSGDGRRVAVLLLNGHTTDTRSDTAAKAAMQRLFCAA